MADDKVVQEIEVRTTGADQAAQEFDKLGQAADDALNKLSDSAATATESVQKLGDEAEKATSQVSDGVDKVAQRSDDVGQALDRLAESFSKGFGKGLTDIFTPITESLNRLSGGVLSGVGTALTNTAANFANFRNAASEAGPALESLFSILKGGAAAFGSEGAAVTALGQALSQLGPLAEAFGASLTGIVASVVAVGAALFETTSHAQELNEAMRLGGQRIGATSEQFAALQEVAVSTGVPLGQLEGALAQIDLGTKRVQDGFAKMGVSLTNLDGSIKDPLQALQEFATKVTSSGTAAEQTRTIIETFGPRFRAITPAIQQLSGGLGDSEAKLKSFGIEFNNLTDSLGHGFVEAAHNVGLAFEGIGQSVGNALGPSFTVLLNGFADLVNGIREVVVQFTGPFFNALNGAIRLVGSLATALETLISKIPGLQTLGNLFSRLNVTNLIPGLGVLNSLGDAFNAAAKDVENYSGQTDAAKAKTDELGNSGPASVAKLTNSFEQLKTQAGGSVSVLSQKVQEANNAFSLLGQKSGSISVLDDRFKTAGESADQLKTRVADADQQVQELAKSGSEAIQESIKSSQTTLQGLGDSVNSAIVPVKAGLASVAEEAANSGTKASQSFQQGFKIDITGIIDSIKTQLSALVTTGQQTGTQAGEAVGTGINTGVSTGLANVPATVQTALAPIAATGAQVGTDTGTQVGTNLGSSLVAALQSFDFTSALSGLQSAMEQLGTTIGTTISTALQGVSQAFSGLIGVASSAGASIQSAMASAAAAVDSVASAARNAASAFDAMAASARAAAAAARDAQAAQAGSGHARGGPILGPGSGTSDSIPAWLSNGEWVIKAAAVRKYGHALFHALNTMQLPKGVLKALRGYADGGLVHSMGNRFAMGGPVSVPRVSFATGGDASSGQTTTLNLTIGGQSFNGLIAPRDVADKLVKYTITERVRSAGRRPTWATSLGE